VKLKIISILLCFFFAKVSLGQEISKHDIIKFKINSITAIDDGGNKITWFYNDKGNLIKKGSLNDNKQLQIDREFLYNNSAYLIEERSYASSGDIYATSKYYYNDKNKLSKKEHISFGEVAATWAFEYDEKGNKNAETYTSGTTANTLTKYKYDEKSLLIQEDKTNNTIGKEETINYKYNEKGQVIEKKTRSYYFNTTIILTYSYNDTGRLTKIYEKSSNGVSSTRFYEYNDKGLLISDTWKSSISKTPQKTTYQISFE
jgi:hypothetical protein